MIISRMSQLLAVVAVTCFFSMAYAEQSKQTKRELQFELSTISIGLPYCPTETKYVGSFHVIKDRNLGSWIFGISETSQWKQMSEAQRQFISKLQNEYRVTERERQRIGSPFSSKTEYTYTPEGMLTYRVHGVSEPDVRRMAEAVIEWLDKKALEKLEEVQKRLESEQNTIAEAQKKLPKLEEECKQLEAQADEKAKKYTEVNYIDRDITKHAEKSMEELARNLRTADFELVGLQARIDLIVKYKTGGKITDHDTLIKLNQMLMADEIERAGVLARRSAYEAAFKLAKELYGAMITRGSVSSQKTAWERKLKNAKEDVLIFEEILDDIPPEMRPVEVYENKVTIHPVRID